MYTALRIGSQRVAQLVGQHCQKLILAAIGLGQLAHFLAKLVLERFPIADVAQGGQQGRLSFPVGIDHAHVGNADIAARQRQIDLGGLTGDDGNAELLADQTRPESSGASSRQRGWRSESFRRAA